MPDFNLWLADAGTLAALPANTEAQRAILAWRAINDKPSSVLFRTAAGADLGAAQTVRLENDDVGTTTPETPAGIGALRRLVIFGVRNHPTVADTNIKEGYRFNLATDSYRVVDVITSLGEIQATAEATG